jgi:hypothetical protein
MQHSDDITAAEPLRLHTELLLAPRRAIAARKKVFRLWFCFGCIVALPWLMPIVTTTQPKSLLERLTGSYLIEAPADCGGQMVRCVAAQLSDDHILPNLRRLRRHGSLGQPQNVAGSEARAFCRLDNSTRQTQ